MRDENLSEELSAELDRHDIGVHKIEVLVADLRAVLDICDKCDVLPHRDLREVLHQVLVERRLRRHVAVSQMARDRRRIAARRDERRAVEAAARHFYLRDAAVLFDLDRLRAALPRELVAARLAMVEDIPLVLHLHDAAVRISDPLNRLRPPLIADVAV